jgi:oligoendopeptidase F
MSKKKPAFVYKSVNGLPKLRARKHEWDLRNHYYKSESDPRIEKDLKITEAAYKAFAKKYRGKNFIASSGALKKALTDYEALAGMAEASRPSRYFWFREALNASDSVAQKHSNLIASRLAKVGNEVIFFELEIGKIPLALQKKYLKDPKLAHFKYYLSRVFLEAKHLLSEPEEKILNLKGNVSHGLWVSGTENILNRRTVSFKGETIPLPSAVDRIDTVPSKDKPKLWRLITEEFGKLAEVAENEMNAIVTNKKINDELRGYEHPYSATIEHYENDEKAVLALVKAISTKGFALSKRYYELKAKFKGVKSFPYANRNDMIGTDIHVPYATAVDVCRDTFYGLDQKYGAIFDAMLTNGQIDVFPKKGRAGGAFCAGGVNVPTYVFLNQVDNQRSFTTLAHEMGHAIHTERSKTQTPIYEDYSTTTAETASTLFEGIAQQKFIDSLPSSEKAAMLDRKIGETIATIQRQIAFFNFEHELHMTIRKEGAMTWKEIAAMMQKHLQSYLGPSVEVTPEDGLMFVYITHIRNFFYVYSYAYGELVSSMIARKLQSDPSYIEKVDKFLTAGGSDTVENIFKSIGIDTTKPETFLESLKSLEADIKELEQLTAKK